MIHAATVGFEFGLAVQRKKCQRVVHAVHATTVGFGFGLAVQHKKCQRAVYAVHATTVGFESSRRSQSAQLRPH